MQGNTLLGSPPNFFVEHLTKSQNQRYCFKTGKNYISDGKNYCKCKKILEFRCQILKKWHHRGSLLTENSKAGSDLPLAKFSKAGCDWNKKCGTPPSKIFRVPPALCSFLWKRIGSLWGITVPIQRNKSHKFVTFKTLRRRALSVFLIWSSGPIVKPCPNN